VIASPDPGLAEEPPLVVDLDGTLVKTDLLLESMVDMLRRAPWLAFAIPFWLIAGRARLKRECAARSRIEPATLPYRDEVIGLVRNERARGRRIVLASACDIGLARGVAAHLGAFDTVFASEGGCNLKGPAKRDRLVASFGERGFDYVADERADLHVWASARRAIVVGADAGLAVEAGRSGQATHIATTTPGWRTWLRALRAGQWPKNLLVFVPLVAAHRVRVADDVLQCLVAFAAFCLVASALYVSNDLADLQADRLHHRKRLRPFASGELGIGAGLLALPLLLAGGFALAWAASPAFAAVVAAYAILGLLYSSALKRVVAVDVVVLAGLYTLRILAGAVAIDVAVSDWLFTFSMFFFFSLAFAKRHGELAKHLDEGAARDAASVPGRGYRPADAPIVAAFGVASGYLSVMVFALYITSGEVHALYRHPAVLWLGAVLLVYWITRLWLLANRRSLEEDPLTFALHDPASYATGALMLLMLYLGA
jgi:4-hydroxybenzoate polyprenyltransferase/phosphoserine phosphatase